MAQNNFYLIVKKYPLFLYMGSFGMYVVSIAAMVFFIYLGYGPIDFFTAWYFITLIYGQFFPLFLVEIVAI